MFIQHHNFGSEPTIRCGKTSRAHNSDTHLHQFFELEMVLEGEIDITVGERCVRVGAGEIAIIPALQLHSFLTPERVRMQICVFSGHFLSPDLSGELFSYSRETHVFRPSEPLWQYLIDSGFSGMRGHSTEYILPDSELRRLRSVFDLIVSEYLAAVPRSGNPIYNLALSKILAYLSANYTDDLSLESVGAALGYSPKYVSNCIATINGVTFRSLLNAMRVERAKELLLSTNGTNLEIALAAGFSSECSFHRVFLATVGCTPGQYRKRKRGAQAT